MKKFIVKIIGAIVVFAFAIVSLYLVNRYFANFKIGNDHQILIIGNSHPECAFNDALIPGVANFSESGESYFYTYIKLKKFLDQNPQIDKVLVEFSNEHIRKSMDKWIWGDMYVSYRFPKYASFMDKEAFDVLMKYNSEGVKKNIPMLSRSNANMLFDDKLDYTKRTGGYLSLDKCKVDSLLADLSVNTNKEKWQGEDSLAVESLRYLDKLVEYSEQKGVEVFFIRSPVHEKCISLRNEETFQKVRLSKYKNIEFLDFSKFYLTNEEFADLSHLNKKGAGKFSVWFAGILKDGLLDSSDKQVFIDDKIKILAKTETHPVISLE